MNDMLAKFGLRVRKIRLDKGWSQEKLAEKAGLHRTYVGSLERGERNVCLLNLYKLADALNIDITEFFQD